MCTQDVIIHHCPCLGVDGELHPCGPLQSRPQGICLHLSHRKLNLPQKCSDCIKKSITVRKGSKWPYTRCRQRKGPLSAAPENLAKNIIKRDQNFSQESKQEVHGDIGLAYTTGTLAREKGRKSVRHAEGQVQIAARSRRSADYHRDRTVGLVNEGGSKLGGKAITSYTKGPPLGAEEQNINNQLLSSGTLENAQQSINQCTQNMQGLGISVVDRSSNTQPTTPQSSTTQGGSFAQNLQKTRSGQMRLVAKKPNPAADSPTRKRLVAKKPASVTTQNTLRGGPMADNSTPASRIPTPARSSSNRQGDRNGGKITTPEAGPAQYNGCQSVRSPIRDSVGGLPVNSPMHLVMERTRRMFNVFNGLPEDIPIELPEFGPALEEWWNRRHADVKFHDMLGGGVRIVPPPQEIGRCTALQAYTFTNDCCFEVGDVVAIYQYYSTEWWRGVNLKTRSGGLFPKNFVTLHHGSLPPPELPAIYPPYGN